MKKIVGFDNWSRGRHHFARLSPALTALGYELILIHIGSWGHDTGCEEHVLTDDFSVRDIRYYNGASFEEIFDLEQPDAVLFLSTRAFAHQAFNRYAEYLGIPTIHLYHGLVNVQYTEPSGQPYRIDWVSHFDIVSKRIKKNIFVLWPVYVKSLIRTRASFRDWYWFFREIYLKGIGSRSGWAPPDSRTTIGCVYTKADVAHMAETYGVPGDCIFVVGNPDLIQFRLTHDLIGSCLDQVDGTQKTVVYIETGLLDAGLVYRDFQDFLSHLVATHASLCRQGYNLTIKLKPHNSLIKDGLKRDLNEAGLDICPDDDFIGQLRHAAGVIVEPSSAAMMPALLGLPLFLARYGRLRGQKFGTVLTSYPRVVHLEELDEFGKLLREVQSRTNRNGFESWVDENAGPLPAEDMPSRVASVINDLVQKTSSENLTGIWRDGRRVRQ